jgi:hypothetical protein
MSHGNVRKGAASWMPAGTTGKACTAKTATTK